MGLEEIDFTKPVYVPEEGLIIPGVKEEIIPKSMEDRIDQVLISEEYIKMRVHALAKKICKDYEGVKELWMYGIIKGSCTLMADLGREIYRLNGPEIKKDYYKLGRDDDQEGTYGDGIKQEGEKERKLEVKLRPKDIKGKNVLLVEDITDQAFTLTAVIDDLMKQRVGQLKTLLLVDKRLDNPTPEVAELKRKLKLDYVGFTVPDRWIAGYDIDAGQDFRHLPFIVTVHEDKYK